MLNKFYHHCERVKKFIHVPTVVLVPEDQSDGSRVIVSKVLEALDNPFVALTFDDFSIQNCLANGVSYGSLGITKDMRIGYEKEFEALETRFMNDPKCFVESSKSE